MKKISPAALHALKEALTHVFWYKKDLRTFITQTLQDADLVNRANWSDYKRNAVSAIVDYMARHEQRYQTDLLALIEGVLEMQDFSHLVKLDDGSSKVRDAEQAVAALHQHAGAYSRIQQERRSAEEARERRLRADEQSRGVRERLAELLEQFMAVVSEPPQPRGYSLERFLPPLFHVFDIDAKASFRLVGEQIDGAFSFDGGEWLFECKWQDAPVGAADLDSFGGKIQRKLDNTLGLFLSINGFSEEGIEAYSKGRSVLILMDGADLMAVVDGRIALDELIRRKKAHAARKGGIFLPVAVILG